MSGYIGNFQAGASVGEELNLQGIDGELVTPGDLAVSAYLKGSTDPLAAAVALNPIANGLFCPTVDTTGFAGGDYSLRISAGTANGKSYVDRVVCTFSIDNRWALADLRSILGVLLTETAGGYLAGAFSKVYDVALAALNINQVASEDDLQQALTDLDSLDTQIGDLTDDVANVQTDLTSALAALAALAAGVWAAATRTITGFTAAALAQLAGTRVINLSIPTLGGNQLSAPIIRGDSYSADQDRQIAFSRADFPDIPDGSTVTLMARQLQGSSGFSWEGSIETSSGTKVVQFAPTAAETADLVKGRYEFEVRVSFPTGDVASFVGPRAYLEVWDDVSVS